MSSTDFENYTSHALNEWDTVFNVDFTTVSYGNGELNVGCISRSNATTLEIPLNAVGVGGVGTMTYSTRYYKPDLSGIVTFYKHSTGFLYLIWDSVSGDGSSKTSDYTTLQWENVATHEVCHSLGYLGHTTMGSSQLMYAYTTTHIEPKYYDTQHKLLVYGKE